MNIVFDIIEFAAIAFFCWRGYMGRQLWLALTVHLLGRLYQNKGFFRQLFVMGPILVGWLLLCHWLNHLGAHGLAAGFMLLAMTIALYTMRDLEERQKQEREG